MSKLKKIIIAVGILVGLLLLAPTVFELTLHIQWVAGFTKPRGALVLEQNQSVNQAVTNFMYKDRGVYCGVDSVGHDQKYIYANVWCANLNGDGTGEGQLDGRLTYSGSIVNVVSIEPVGEDNQNPSTQQIYPYAAYKKISANQQSQSLINQLLATAHKMQANKNLNY